MTNLLTFNYWFNLSPASFIKPVQIIFIIFLAILLILGIVFSFYKNKKGSFRSSIVKLQEFSFLNLFIGLLLFFFDRQSIMFFSARFWYLVWIAFMIFSLWKIIKNFKKMAGRREERAREREFKKYLP